MIFIFLHSFIHHFAGFSRTNKTFPSQLTVKRIPPRFITATINSHLYSLIRSSYIFFSYSHSHFQKWDTLSVTLCWVSKVILVCLGFDLLRSMIGWKNCRHFFNQWEAKAKSKPIVTWSHPSFSRAWSQLFDSNSDWYLRLISFGLVLKHSLLF